MNPKKTVTVVGGDMEDNNEGLQAAAEDILSAVESKDVGALKEALQSFCELCDEMPHEEGPHEENTLGLGK